MISLNLSNSLNINCLPEKLGKMWVNYKGQHYDFIPIPPSNPIPKAIHLTKKRTCSTERFDMTNGSFPYSLFY